MQDVRRSSAASRDGSSADRRRFGAYPFDSSDRPFDKVVIACRRRDDGGRDDALQIHDPNGASTTPVPSRAFVPYEPCTRMTALRKYNEELHANAIHSPKNMIQEWTTAALFLTLCPLR